MVGGVGMGPVDEVGVTRDDSDFSAWPFAACPLLASDIISCSPDMLLTAFQTSLTLYSKTLFVNVVSKRVVKCFLAKPIVQSGTPFTLNR